jgi:hypothetical protein
MVMIKMKVEVDPIGLLNGKPEVGELLIIIKR